MSRMITKKTGKQRPETNIERLTRIMEYSECGPIMQAFIIDSLCKWAEIIKKEFEENPNCMGENCIVNPAAWRACAEEICEEFGI